MSKLKPGTNYCQCAACGAYFGGVTAFDMHRAGPGDNRACIPPAEVADKHGKALRLDDLGYWVRIAPDATGWAKQA